MLVANHYFEGWLFSKISRTRNSRDFLIARNSTLLDHIPTELHDLSGIDAVAAADTIKQLVKLGKSSEHVSLLIHRIGDSLFMDDFNLEKLFRDTSSQTHHWFKSYLSEILAKDGNFNQLENELISALTKHLRSTSIKALESKFLYHSLMPAQDGQEARRQEPCAHEGCFLQNNVWKFHDLGFLVGSDIPIFGNKNHPAVTLRLTDSQEINVLTGIDYWLENLMFSVPEVVMCFHINGIVEKYENISTDDIPKLAGFDPEMVKTTAKSILSFLKSKCTEPGHTYWLFKEKNDDVVKLYDLSSLCDTKKDEKKKSQKPTNPYVTPVANLLLRLVTNLENETETIPVTDKKLRDENDENVTKLLHQALQISDDLPEVREKVLRKLAFRMSRKKSEPASSKKPTKTRKPSQNLEKTKGATCVMKTSEIVNQYVHNSQSFEASKGKNDMEEELKWISAACQLLGRDDDPTDVYLAFSSALATFAEREQVGTKPKDEELALILLAIR